MKTGQKLDEKLPISAATRKRNAHYWPEKVGAFDGPTFDAPISLPKKTAKRIRQSDKPLLNKLEAEWLRILEQENLTIYSQAVKLRLGNGVWYCPDFMTLVGSVKCWEVKGPKVFDDSIVKLKCAASLFRGIEFILVWKENGLWNKQIVIH